MKYTTYLFDFDYTLVDASSGVITCLEYALNKANITDVNRQSMKETIGMGVQVAFQKLTGLTEEEIKPLLTAFNEKANEVMTQNTTFLPHADNVVRSLSIAGNKIGIVSNKNSNLILEYLVQTMMIPYVDIVVGGDSVELGKPAPDGVEHVLNSLKVKKNTVVYLGDSEIDAQTAAAAGVDFIAVTTGTTPADTFEQYPHIAIISSLVELLELK